MGAESEIYHPAQMFHLDLQIFQAPELGVLKIFRSDWSFRSIPRSQMGTQFCTSTVHRPLLSGQTPGRNPGLFLQKSGVFERYLEKDTNLINTSPKLSFLPSIPYIQLGYNSTWCPVSLDPPSTPWLLTHQTHLHAAGGVELLWPEEVKSLQMIRSQLPVIESIEFKTLENPVQFTCLKNFPASLLGPPLHTSIPRVDSAVVMQIVISWRRTEWSRAQSCVTTCVFPRPSAPLIPNSLFLSASSQNSAKAPSQVRIPDESTPHHLSLPNHLASIDGMSASDFTCSPASKQFIMPAVESPPFLQVSNSTNLVSHPMVWIDHSVTIGWTLEKPCSNH